MTLAEKKAERYKKSNIKVLMFGASRVGKTSLLAKMTEDQFLAKVISGTKLTLELENDNIAGLKDALKTMEGYFVNDGSRSIADEFVLNDNPSAAENDFRLKIGLGKKDSAYSIGFTDIPGEWVNNYNFSSTSANSGKVKDLVREADVLMITIDSVLLYEGEGRNADEGNRISNVINIIKTCYSGEAEKSHKLVLFVPVKCEKYYHQHIAYLNDPRSYDEDPMLALLDLVETKYAPLISFMKNAENISYFTSAITPVLTLGNIQFSMFTNYTGVPTAADMNFRYLDKFSDVPPIESLFCDQPLVYALLFEIFKIRRIKEIRKGLPKMFDSIVNALKGLANEKGILAEIGKLSQNLIRDVITVGDNKQGKRITGMDGRTRAVRPDDFQAYTPRVINDPFGMIIPRK